VINYKERKHSNLHKKC